MRAKEERKAVTVTGKKAYQILGMEPGAGRDEIKRRYRRLMQLVHPDVEASSRESYEYSVQEINAAYAFLMKEMPAEKKEKTDGDTRTEKNVRRAAWDASINENAFVEREIRHRVEAYDGTVLGDICVAKGKYLWRTDEDFPLFLKSLCHCSKRLLEEADEEAGREPALLQRMKAQSELTYLLAQQFIDSTVLLRELAKKETTADGKESFYISAMLEAGEGESFVRTGEALYPAGIRQHRLFLKNQAGKTLGYLSFGDDRFYYVVIPLFEKRRVQVKIQAAEGSRKGKKFRKLDLWLRFLPADVSRMPENLNLQIEKLLKDYKEKAWP